MSDNKIKTFFTHDKDGKPKIHQFRKGELEDYKAICEMIWGGYPLDLDWARNTNLYKEAKAIYEQKSNRCDNR
jgi:hypothetical protein